MATKHQITEGQAAVLSKTNILHIIGSVYVTSLATLYHWQQPTYLYQTINSPSLHLFQALPCLLYALCDPTWAKIHRIECRYERAWGNVSCVYSHGHTEQHIIQNKSKELWQKLYLPWILAYREDQRDQGGRLQDTAEDRDKTLRTLHSLCTEDTSSVYCHYASLTGAWLRTYQKVTAKIMKSTRKALTGGEMTTQSTLRHVSAFLVRAMCEFRDPLGGSGKIQHMTISYPQHQLSSI